ncbi:hypothetical protein [Actinomyces oris]|uniref:hypothetical protein n=1 Tax=Actinomyces oris TaxID=544580 RepID=UPI002116DD6C|nr:hypothetical protein [Actinomyces oris]
MPDIIKGRAVRLMSVRRREVLALGAVSLAFGVGGCSPFALALSKKKRKVRKYLSGLDGVTSVEVDVDPGLVTDDRWDVAVNLKGDPGQDSVLAIIRNARNEVVSLVDSDKVELDVTWTQGATSMSCHLPTDDLEEAVPAVMKVITSEVESVEISWDRIRLRYHGVKTLPDNFILPLTSPVVGVGSLKTGQIIRVGSSYCYITHFKGVDLTSVPIKSVLDAIPADKRVNAMVDLDAHNDVNQVTQLRVRGLGEYGKGVDVGAAAPVLAAVLGNRTLQRVELATAPNDDYDSEVVAFDMNGGAVVGQGDPPEKGAPILAAAQQAASSSS